MRRRFDFAKDLSMKSLSHETHTESVWRLSFPHCRIHSEFLRGTTPSRLKNLPCPPAPPLDGRGRGMHVSMTPTPIGHGLVCQPNGRRLPPKHTPESSSPREKAHTLYPPSPLTRPPSIFAWFPHVLVTKPSYHHKPLVLSTSLASLNTTTRNGVSPPPPFTAAPHLRAIPNGKVQNGPPWDSPLSLLLTGAGRKLNIHYREVGLPPSERTTPAVSTPRLSDANTTCWLLPRWWTALVGFSTLCTWHRGAT